MRENAVVELLTELDPNEAAGLCSELLRAARKGAPFDEALLALGAALDDARIGYERRAAIYAAALGRSDGVLARLLLSPEEPPPGSLEADHQSELTLGHRKAFARTAGRDRIERFLGDPDPAVLGNLLENPRVTESDVVRLAARRPTTAEAQRAILGSRRFAARYGVRRAIVFNPYTPSDLAARLVLLLTRPDQKAIVEDSRLPETVRAVAQAELAKK